MVICFKDQILTNALICVMCRFRKNPVALMCDIYVMYICIYIITALIYILLVPCKYFFILSSY